MVCSIQWRVMVAAISASLSRGIPLERKASHTDGVDEGGNDVKVVASAGCVAECPGHHLGVTDGALPSAQEDDHSSIASMMGCRAPPASVRAYSTRGGTSR